MRSPRLTATAVAMIAVALALFAPTGAALADPTSTSAPEAAAAQDAELLIVLDSSSSMLEQAGDGVTRAEAAKSALLGVVDSLSETDRVGLRQFGATVAGLNDPASCTDSQLTVPVATDNRQALRDAANAYLPYGETPIGYALQEAGKDLPAASAGASEPESQRTILLITDGESNCEPDPCAIAATLAAEGLTIHVVGFQVSGQARDALLCVANAGGGQYFDVNDSAGLASVFEKVATRAFRDFALSGDPVQGAPDRADAPTLTGGSRYLTTLPALGEPLYYEIERTIAGSRLWVTATMGAGPAQEIEGTLQTSPEADASTCNSSKNFASAWTGVWNVPILTLDSTDREKCVSTSSMMLMLESGTTGDSSTSVLAGTPAEILVFEEAPVTNIADLPPASPELGAWVPITETAPLPVEGGTAFSDAPLLGSGSYSFDLLPGEVTYVSIQLDWGQSLQAQYTSSRGLDLTMLSPVRDSLSSNETTIDVPDPESDAEGESVRRDAIRTPPVTYRARESDDWNQPLAHAGTWTLAISTSQEGATDLTALVPVTLDLLIDGEPTGAPTYLQAAAPPAAPSSTPEVTTAQDGADSTSPLPRSSPEDGGMPAVVPLAVGVVGLALIVGGAVAFRRRRTSSTLPTNGGIS